MRPGGFAGAARVGTESEDERKIAETRGRASESEGLGDGKRGGSALE